MTIPVFVLLLSIYGADYATSCQYEGPAEIRLDDYHDRLTSGGKAVHSWRCVRESGRICFILGIEITPGAFKRVGDPYQCPTK